MDLDLIKDLLTQALSPTDIKVKAEGSHLEVTVVSNDFADMRSVKRQQAVYAPLMELIADGTVHAIAIKALTEEEWRKHKLLNF
ncbi:BolA family protein [Algibacillus agarilyticus]|uniref:BolA family protein n=1 Tax=Algibacillus agarilyticus TaxID=2234133 RepID=UPI000DD0168C|nr:BolA/IbaG family iron-sulfur metabolism protein [Algibacillus agarilyticus]